MEKKLTMEITKVVEVLKMFLNMSPKEEIGFQTLMLMIRKLRRPMPKLSLNRFKVVSLLT